VNTEARHGRKRAEQVARLIRQEIIDTGWQVGAVLGNEQELLGRFGVGRSVLREAVRIVEHSCVARMRQGPGGGLVVTTPDITALTITTAAYFAYRGVTLSEVLDSRRVVEGLAAELASHRAEGSDTRVPDVDEPFHGTVGALSGNPGVELLVELLRRLTAIYAGADHRSAAHRRRDERNRLAAHSRIADAIRSGDAVLARLAMRHHLDEVEASLLGQHPDGRIVSVAPDPAAPRGKLGRDIALSLFNLIIERGWPVGEQLGSEPELVIRFGASRPTIREAIRLLEFHRIVRTQRGPGGGVFVREPSVDALVDALAVHLDHRRIDLRRMFEVSNAIELDGVRRAAVSTDSSTAQRLQEILEDGRAVDDTEEVCQHFHTAVVGLTGNRVAPLLLQVLMRLPQVRGWTWPAEARTVRRAHASIASAVVERDSDKALRRMSRHLDAIAAVPH
jgi:DNA-binding FadR family transcriptional regulator